MEPHLYELLTWLGLCSEMMLDSDASGSSKVECYSDTKSQEGVLLFFWPLSLVLSREIERLLDPFTSISMKDLELSSLLFEDGLPFLYRLSKPKQAKKKKSKQRGTLQWRLHYEQ